MGDKHFVVQKKKNCSSFVIKQNSVDEKLFVGWKAVANQTINYSCLEVSD